MRKGLLRLLVPVLLGGAFVLSLSRIGRWALEQLHGQERFNLAFADIDCLPPPQTSREAFLAEVRYLGELPARLPYLDDRLAGRLADAFACHPWVEKVERVEVLPPRQVRVRLVYRTPALAVPLGEHVRVVDQGGVLLPVGRGATPTSRPRRAPPAT
jgi:hypothetical protein